MKFLSFFLFLAFSLVSVSSMVAIPKGSTPNLFPAATSNGQHTAPGTQSSKYTSSASTESNPNDNSLVSTDYIPLSSDAPILKSGQPQTVKFRAGIPAYFVLNPADFEPRQSGDSLVIELSTRLSSSLIIWVSTEIIHPDATHYQWRIAVPPAESAPILAHMLLPMDDPKSCEKRIGAIGCKYFISVLIPESTEGEIVAGAAPIKLPTPQPIAVVEGNKHSAAVPVVYAAAPATQ